ncbi:hypothetical protein NP493_2262g00003 [Ridgeia piscesae]|uniref:Uncharacterized protein n=1 Tax=Ridgeia piscesae TaxID=27915 RepID=A0AAD9JJC8_RIDPI|nr:hypothetical protein NP493_2262g00003 [Ridgeia piscesae]
MAVARTNEAWCTSLCQTLNTLRESSMFCDVIIRASNGHMFKAHTCILAASSSVLKAQLLKSQHYVNMSNITERMWQVLLQFMYSGTVEIVGAVEIPSIVEIGKQLQLTELVIVCEDLLRDSSEQHAFAAREEVFHGSEETGHSSHENEYTDGTMQSTSDCVGADAVKEPVQQSALSCNLCGKTFRRTAALHHHMGEHTGDKAHICHECGRSFSQRSSLNRHKQIHIGVKPHSCPVCDKAFFRVSHLVAHERQVHAIAKPHKCSDCSEAFSTRSGLVAHERMHVEEKLLSFPCTECDKDVYGTGAFGETRTDTLGHRSNLWRHRCTEHEHTPTGGKPFACAICGRTFRLKSSLARHEEIHSNVKRHLCVVCGKRFAKLLNLSAHARTHLDRRPYKCTMCDKAFKDGSNLRRHKLTHSDEKPFLCAACGKGFYRKVDMMEHFHRKHSAEKPFKCLVCGTGFSCRRDLNRHPCYKRADDKQNSDVAGRSMHEQDQHTEESAHSLTLDSVDMLDLVDVQTADIDVNSDSLAQYTAQSTEQSTQPVNVNTVHILSAFLNADKVPQHLITMGNAFHRRGPITRKDRSPKLASFVRGMSSKCCSDERVNKKLNNAYYH